MVNSTETKKKHWRNLIISHFVIAVVTALGTIITVGTIKGFKHIVPVNHPKYQTILTAPITDNQTGRRFQFFSFKNTGVKAIEKFVCNISCVRTVEVSEVHIIDFNGTAKAKRTPEKIYLEADTIPSGGCVIMVVWHKLGGIEPSDIMINWRGKIVKPKVDYLM